MFARRPLPAIAGAVLAGAVALLIAWAAGPSTSFSDPDESAHYVNALFLGDWLRAGLPSPMAFARDFYAHFPKLSIGHWPPGWYALLAPVFAVARPSPLAAHLLSAFVAGLPAGFILWGAARSGHPRTGVAAAAAYLVLPLVVDGIRHFLLDQPVTLVVGLAAIAWASVTERATWPRCLWFAALVAAAPLVKGNGALVALLPVFDILIGRRWHLLREPRLWLCGVLAVAVVAPWYWVSFRISAGGFNYAPGPAYAWLALTQNIAAVLANVGAGGVLLAGAGLWFAWASRGDRPEAWRVAALALSLILATLLFQSLVPAALAPRYVTPLLPWLVVLAAVGAVGLWGRGFVARIACVLLVLAALFPVRSLAHPEPDPDIDAPRLAAMMRARPGIWLVDGRSGGEGAVIAAAAYADAGRRRIWVARATQWLSTSDFMGRGYQVSAHNPAEVHAVLDRLGVQGIVSIALHGKPAYPHSVILRDALADPAYARMVVPFRREAGSSLLVTRRNPVRSGPALLAAGSSNVARIGAAIP